MNRVRYLVHDESSDRNAFACLAPLQMKCTIKVLKMHQSAGGAEGESFTNGLMNALRYTTKHLNDEDTPKAIKALLA